MIHRCTIIFFFLVSFPLLTGTKTFSSPPPTPQLPRALDYFVYRNDLFALLSGTLKTYQKAVCDEEWLTLRCPIGTTMSIQLAQYGKVAPTPALCSTPSSIPNVHDVIGVSGNVSCLWPTAIQTVVGLCQKKVSCKFQTSPRTFGGDPCPGSRKYVEVAYKCRPSEFKSVIGCENEVVQLKCNRSSRIAIYSANFGRTEYESIQCPQPKGVHEETCLSSYATETVMQICHGKRSCALGVDLATFGSPCKPESTMYLKVIHTCVPRQVFKEKYQGEPESDEVFEDDYEVKEGTDDPVVEQPSIYSPDHSKGWATTRDKTSPKPIQTRFNQPPPVTGESSEERIGEMHVGGTEWSGQSFPDITVIGDADRDYSKTPASIVSIISKGIQAYDFISKNPEKVYLYVAISVASGLLMLVLLLLLKIWIHRNRPICHTEAGVEQRHDSRLDGTGNKPSPSFAVPFTSAISDTDDLSLDHQLNDPRNSADLDLHSILRTPSSYGEQIPIPSTHTLSTIGRPNEVVRFSNNVDLFDLDESHANPRSLDRNRMSASNIHFYYE